MNLKVLSKELSKELKLNPDLIEKIGKSQFKLLVESIREENFVSIYLKFIGRWGVKPERIKYFGKSREFLNQGDTNI